MAKKIVAGLFISIVSLAGGGREAGATLLLAELDANRSSSSVAAAFEDAIPTTDRLRSFGRQEVAAFQCCH